MALKKDKKEPEKKRCPNCNGTGKERSVECPRCGGDGYVYG